MTKLMTNQTTTFAGEMKLGLVCESEMRIGDFNNKLHPICVIGGTVKLMLANGKEIELDITDIQSSSFTAFHEDGYEIHEEDEVGAF
jgi:hypothetical protein